MTKSQRFWFEYNLSLQLYIQQTKQRLSTLVAIILRYLWKLGRMDDEQDGLTFKRLEGENEEQAALDLKQFQDVQFLNIKSS